MKVQILAYDLGPFDVTEGITNDMVQSEMEIKIGAVLKYRLNNDVVGAMVTLMYQSGEKQLLLFGVMLTMLVPDWTQLIKSKSDEEIKRSSIPIWDVALNFASGMLVEKAKDSKMKDVFLPPIDRELFAKSITLEKVD